MSDHSRYSFYVLGSAIGSAIAWILTEITFQFYHISPLVVACGAMLCGGSVLRLLTLDRTNSKPTWKRRDWIGVIVAGVMIYALGFLLSFNAINLIGAGKGALLGRLDSIFVVLLSIIFLGERLSARRWFAGGLALFGAVVLNFNPQALEFSFGFGEFLLVLAVLCVATGIVTLKPVLGKVDPGQVTSAAMLIGGGCLAVIMLFSTKLELIVWPALLIILIMGSIRGFSWFVYNTAMPHIGASLAAIIFTSSGFFTATFQIIVASIAPNLGLQLPKNLTTAFIGGALIVLAIILLQTERQKAT